MKAGWQTKKLGELIRLEYGKPLPDEKRKADGKYPVYGANGEKDRTDEFYFDKPSIIVGRKGSAGEINLTEEKFWPLDVTYFVEFDEKEFHLKFLYSLLATLDLPKLAKGVKPGINRNEVYSIGVKVPPLPEQQRIVAILDEAFAGIATAIANAKKNLNNARELFESYLQSVFENKGEDWEEKTLGEIAEIKGGKRVPKGYKLEFEKTNHPYIRVADFNDYGSIDLNNIRYVNDKVFKEIKNYTISKDDLYISIAGTIGRTGIVPDELDGANLTENACKLVFKECIDKKFVYYFTKTKSFEIQAGLNTRTAAMPKLALIRLATIKFSIPKSVKIQNTFVQKFEALSKETKKLESIYQQKLVALGELKKSLLDQAFSGEL